MVSFNMFIVLCCMKMFKIVYDLLVFTLNERESVRPPTEL